MCYFAYKLVCCYAFLCTLCPVGSISDAGNNFPDLQKFSLNLRMYMHGHWEEGWQARLPPPLQTFSPTFFFRRNENGNETFQILIPKIKSTEYILPNFVGQTVKIVLSSINKNF